MKTTYRRDMDHNYLVIEHEEYRDIYQIGMLIKNRIPGLLECSADRMDAGILFYYEITSRQSLGLLLERKKLSGSEMTDLLEGILRAVRSCSEYLLDAEKLLLAPEYIYLDPDEWTVFLCMDPLMEAEACGNSLQSLAEYLLEHIDRQDPDAVSLGYEFYRMAGEENPSIGRLLDSRHAAEAPEGDSAEPEKKKISANVYEKAEASPSYASERSGDIGRTPEKREASGTVCLAGGGAPGITLHSQNGAYPDFRITKDSFLVGKKKDAVDGFLKARGISRIHGRISKEGDFYYITDLNSTNGTFLNGGRLDVHEKAKLRSGDCVGFADVKYVVEAS